MRSLILSDWHHRWETVEKIINHNNTVDRIISLSDEFDDFGDTPKDAENTAVFLKKCLNLPNFISTVGNHSLFYFYPKVSWLRCSGNTKEKCEVIRKTLGDDIYKFHFYHWDEYFLYTHAGLNPYFLPPDGFSPEWMEKRCQQARLNCEAGIPDPILCAGYSRGGNLTSGGITWCDWEYDFVPIEGLNQICGHTPGRFPRVKLGKNSVNYCIDTHSKHYAIVADGKVDIFDSFSYELLENY